MSDQSLFSEKCLIKTGEILRQCAHTSVRGVDLRVHEHTEVQAHAVVVASGSSPWVPPQLEPVKALVSVNDDVFEWTDLPESVAVVGTGVIGLELGQALHRLGVRVTFFSPFDALGPISDPAVVTNAQEVLGAELDLQLKSSVDEVEHDGTAFRVAWTTSAGEQRQATFDRIIAAAGRRPNLGGMNIEAAGVELDHRGVPVHDDRMMQCGTSSVFVAGDLCGHLPLLHEADDEGRIAGSNAARFSRTSRRRSGERRWRWRSRIPRWPSSGRDSRT